MAKSTTMKKKAVKKKATKKKAAKRAKRARTPKKTVGKCFVMMPFHEPFETYHSNIILPAITRANFEPTRADDLFRPSVIVADMWKMIQDARVLLAVLTTKNANVFYELGLAHAIGKPVVLVSETLDDVPFDLQSLRVLLYDKNDPAWGGKLRQDIGSALVEVTDDPIEAVPQIFRRKVPSKAPVETDQSRLAGIEKRLARLEHGTPGWASYAVGAGGEALAHLRAVANLKELEQWFDMWGPRYPGAALRRIIRKVVTEGGKELPPSVLGRLLHELHR